jgi:phosphoglycerol transferase MdoB-like AlkP superfamily enzyme
MSRKNIDWKKVVEIQYNGLHRNVSLYITILAALFGFIATLKIPLHLCSTLIIVAAFVLVLIQSFAIVWLTNIQREASWEDANNLDLNNRETQTRIATLTISAASTLFVMASIAATFVEYLNTR